MERRPPLPHLGRLLKGVGKAQQAQVALILADNLDADRQPFGSEAARHRDGRQPGDADVVARLHPVEVGVERDAVDFGHILLGHREGRNLGNRGDQEGVAVHKLPHAVVQLGAFTLRPSDLGTAQLLALLDIPDHRVFHLSPMLGQQLA